MDFMKAWESITEDERNQLIDALNDDVTCLITVAEGCFLGVNVPVDFEIKEEKGYFCYGNIR